MSNSVVKGDMRVTEQALLRARDGVSLGYGCIALCHGVWMYWRKAAMGVYWRKERKVASASDQESGWCGYHN